MERRQIGVDSLFVVAYVYFLEWILKQDFNIFYIARFGCIV